MTSRTIWLLSAPAARYIFSVIALTPSIGISDDREAAHGPAVFLIVKHDATEIHVAPERRSRVRRRNRASEAVLVLETNSEWLRIHDGWIAAEDVISANDAVDYYSTIIETNPSSSAHACRARAYLMLGRTDEGLADAERATSLDGHYAPGWYSLGSARRLKGDVAGAKTAYHEAIHLAPDFGAAHSALGLVLYLTQRYENAALEFNEAVANGGGDANTFCQRGACFLMTGKPQLAIDDFTRAIELSNGDSVPYENRARAYRNVGLYDRAIADANRAIELSQWPALAFSVRGSIRRAMEDDDGALRDFARSIDLDPKLVHPLVSRAALYVSKGRYGNARVDIERALRLDPANPGALGMRGTLRLHEGDFEQALDDLTKSVSLDPNIAEARSARGEVLAAMGDYRAAARELAEGTRLDSFSAPANRRRARLLSQCPDPAIRDGRQAFECAKRACELTKYRDAESLSLLASAYAELSDFQSALRYLDDAVRLAPHDEDFVRQAEAQRQAYKDKRPWRFTPPTPRRL